VFTGSSRIAFEYSLLRSLCRLACLRDSRVVLCTESVAEVVVGRDDFSGAENSARVHVLRVPAPSIAGVALQNKVLVSTNC
jgi:hypothetical protein